MKKVYDMVDIALTNEDFGVAEGKYFICENGAVKTASKKIKKTIKDARGYEMVVVETMDGESVALYIADLMTAAFGAEDQDMFNLKKLAAAQNRPAGTSRSGRRSKFTLKNESGEEFNSFAAAARSVDAGYDKFYNTFYTKKLTEATINGVLFTIVFDKAEEAVEA